MKELSIEEKATAYDEAIEYAHYLIDERCKEGTDGSFHRLDLEKMFPELKESEDERIRKALMQNLKERFGTKGNMGKGLDMPDVLAWLGKQGEQKPAEVRTTGYWNVQDIEQKPAWSEEDENKINRLIAYFEDKESFTAEDYDVYTNWLKSLKDTVQPKQQEWSEEEIESCAREAEDNNCIILAKHIRQLKSLRPQSNWKPVDKNVYVVNGIVLAQKKDKSDLFKGYILCKDHTLTPDEYERYINISDINSQSHWKPSEEQMKALYDSIPENVKEISEREMLLNELYKDLKKL